ncbi:MAG: NAD(P)H-hydrate epimerase [Candidatus Omnitrophica bacterium]|nr:NAD(P)H-hydrate epimerase [Candidatus Omnitrophota bacterium]
MKHAVTAARMRDLDRRAIEEFGIPGLILMENAGRSVAEAALRMLAKPWSKRQVHIFCGKGNNGGDGFVAGRHLMNHGVSVTFHLLARPSDLKGDALVNFQIVKKMKAEWKGDIRKSDLVIDAIFGTGLAKNLEEPYLSAIRLMNQSRVPVLSIDIPSGLNADTGRVMGDAVRARRTVTLAIPKKGLFIGTGPKYTGAVEVGYIALPSSIFPRKSR